MSCELHQISTGHSVNRCPANRTQGPLSSVYKTDRTCLHDHSLASSSERVTRLGNRSSYRPLESRCSSTGKIYCDVLSGIIDNLDSLPAADASSFQSSPIPIHPLSLVVFLSSSPTPSAHRLQSSESWNNDREFTSFLQTLSFARNRSRSTEFDLHPL